VFGERLANGRTPVYVDGAKEPTGYVWTSRHGAQPWATEGSDTYPAGYPGMSARRWLAAERIVDLVDARRLTGKDARGRALESPVPEGWRTATWDEIVREGFRRVRLVDATAYVDPEHDGQSDAGQRYVTAYQAEPVRLSHVSRLSRVPHLQKKYGDFLSITSVGKTFSLTVDGNHAIALGALVPVDSPRRTVSAAPCPECGAHGGLYTAGPRTACGECMCRDLGWELDDLPRPLVDGGPVFDPGDVVALDVVGTDGVIDTHTGTVKEWRACLDEGTRSVSVVFCNMGWATPCAPALLRTVERVPEGPNEVVGGFALGAEVCFMRAHERRPQFGRQGRVVGFSTCPVTGARMVRVSTMQACASPATPHLPEHLLTPGKAAGPGPYLR